MKIAPHCTIYTFDGSLVGNRSALAHRLPHKEPKFHFVPRPFDENAVSFLQSINVSQVNLLKMDCEGCEEAVLRPFLNKIFVKQLTFETHGCLWSRRPGNSKAALLRVHKLMTALHNHRAPNGFRIFYSEPNIQYSDGTCVEYSMLRPSTNLPDNST